MWDSLLEKTELTLNLLHQAMLNPSMSAWDYFNGPFDFAATSLGPMGCQVIIHSKPSKQKSWDQYRREDFNVGPSLQHYQCWTLLDGKTKAIITSDTVEFLHS